MQAASLSKRRSVSDGFAALVGEVDRQTFKLERHEWRYFPWWTGQRWLWTTACAQCGLKYERTRWKQICLGVIGELLLAGEKVPARWRHDFPERVRLAHRAWKTKGKRK